MAGSGRTHFKLHGKPEQVVNDIHSLLGVDKGELRQLRRRRQWGRDLGKLITELAKTNIAPHNLHDHISARLVTAVERERTRRHHLSSGMLTV